MTAIRSQLNRVVLVVGLLVSLPVICISERVRAGRGRAVARRASLWVGRLCGVRFEIDPAFHAASAPRRVVVANHSSPLDIPALLVADPSLRFVAAAELFRVPLLRGAMRALGTIPIDRANRRDARRRLAELATDPAAVAVAIFPEGGIAPRGDRFPFTTGAFALAIDLGSEIWPVAIHGTGDVLPPRAALRVRPGHVVVELLEPIPTTGRTGIARKTLRDQAEVAIAGALDARRAS